LVFKDIAGAVLSEGDQVTFPIGLGTLVVANVQKIDTLVQGDAPQSIHLSFTLSLPAAPNGLVPGIIKIPQPSIVNDPS
jgi:hypothetical protein